MRGKEVSAAPRSGATCLRVWDLGFGVVALDCGFWGVGWRVLGLELSVQIFGLGFGV
jgi:hypothetical protein